MLILTNSVNVSKTGIIDNGVSDQSLVYVIRKFKRPKDEPKILKDVRGDEKITLLVGKLLEINDLSSNILSSNSLVESLVPIIITVSGLCLSIGFN